MAIEAGEEKEMGGWGYIIKPVRSVETDKQAVEMSIEQGEEKAMSG